MEITNKALGLSVCLSANSGKSGSSKALTGGLFYSSKYRSGKWHRFMLDESVMSGLLLDINFPGTYAIFIHGQCFYIGQSGNILNRLRNHIQMARYSNTWKTPWGYYSRILIAIRKERFRYERLTVEKRLIEKFKPKYNKLLNNKNESITSISILS